MSQPSRPALLVRIAVLAVAIVFFQTGVVSEVLAASIRHPEHVVTAAKLGCEVATVPGKVLRQMLDHPLTTAGIERFNADWRSRPEFAQWLDGLVSANAPAEGAAAEGAPAATR